MKIRRVVTGHDKNGKAVIVSDGEMQNVKTMASGNKGCLMWMTETTPASVDDDTDPAKLDMDIAPPTNGTVLRILEVAPGKSPFMHRTDTIDYCIMLEGECAMVLDDGEEVTLKTGDILVQRGTWHGWANRTDKPARLAFILMGSQKPAKHLHDH